MEKFLASIERRAFLMARVATSDTEEAMDIVQEAMLLLVRKYRNKPEQLWKPLFYRILQNRIRDWYRRTAVRSRLMIRFRGRSEDENGLAGDPLENIEDPSGDNPAKLAIQGEASGKLLSALAKLPRRQQQAFLLRAWEGLSVSETAGAMRCSEGSVKTHYSRAVRSLRDQLEDVRP